MFKVMTCVQDHRLKSYFETYAFDRRSNLLAMKQAIEYTNNLSEMRHQSQHLGIVFF